jgi:hypothetical protein
MKRWSHKSNKNPRGYKYLKRWLIPKRFLLKKPSQSAPQQAQNRYICLRHRAAIRRNAAIAFIAFAIASRRGDSVFQNFRYAMAP